MTLLRTMHEEHPESAVLLTEDPAEIGAALAEHGIHYERWDTARGLPADAGDAEVLDAYRTEIAKVGAEGGYTLIDVARLRPDPADPGWPERARAARSKFLEEHRHAEDEVRFFAAGRGCFYLHLGPLVHAVVCEAGDLLSVPAGTAHWFDMGGEPEFTAVRFFQSADGWVGDFCEVSIASRFPTLDRILAERR
ncbi:1,2-dihydroxy-3-keto-5-methylthiopentene dioxygenase [Kitasatospora sp. MAP12-15]|uniref:1,2-dihydroxy-3-keto-5-methylthiopentene dioxygenase n=1 Tax=unclassified Kitasatospora TaxID=2633591 RepID=UPI002474683B|nr:cupin [Kitasatospora sp. MAP12-44]MDH6109383.1 1,2-dihydroxy-3-keto-5-methylthiopentene dioxygenase [Kitasatospora sp. MAP12-44]